MRRSLVNTFLGILTISEVHELIDIFKGKGRRKITPFLEEFLKEISSNEVLYKDEKKILLQDDSLSDSTVELGSDNDNQTQGNLKGVLFILDSFRKTRKYQGMLKSREIISLYKNITNQPITKLDNLTESNNNSTKSKGILINKKVS